MNNSHNNSKPSLNGKTLSVKPLIGLACAGLLLNSLGPSGSTCLPDEATGVAKTGDWDKTAKELYDIRLVLQRYSSKEKELKERLVKLSDNESMHNDNYEFKKSFSAGLIDYIKIINDYEIDVEKYRKNENTRWKLTKL